MNRTTVLTATTAVLALAACSSGTHSNSMAVPTAPSASQSATATPTTASTLPPGVSLSNEGHYSPPGPFKITPLSCGPYTAAQKAQFGAGAVGGLVYSYTNVSNTLTGVPDLSVNFLQGSNVIGRNFSHIQTPIGPGQTSQNVVDALSGSGSDLSDYTCELMSYTLNGPGSSSFAP